MWRDNAYYTSEAWYTRRDAIRTRAHGHCEFCRLRPMAHCHHRTYAHFGNEPLVDLMAVCGACHHAIHGLAPMGRALTCTRESLLAQGDTGMGCTEAWEAYLATKPTCSWCGWPMEHSFSNPTVPQGVSCAVCIVAPWRRGLLQAQTAHA
jgi:hypothetical protein